MAKQKPVEWKPTAEPWVIDREFSTFVKNRCIFFHARAAKWRKMFNFAAKFVAPNRIVVLYIYGAIKRPTMEKMLNSVPHQLLVIVLPINSNDLADYDAGCLTERLIAGWGLSEEAVRYNLAEAQEKAKGVEDSVLSDYISDLRHHIGRLDMRQSAIEHIRQDQHSYATMLSNFTAERILQDDHNAELLSIICDIYPCGVEANAPTEAGAKILLIKRLVHCAFERNVSDAVMQCVGDLDRTQISFFQRDNSGAVQLLEDMQTYCTAEIQKRGCFSLRALMQMLAAPPYGYYDCNYYAYLRARILTQYAREPYMVFLGVAAFCFGVEADSEMWLRSPSGVIFMEGEKQARMCEALSELFPIERLPFERTGGVFSKVSFAREWISNHIETPLACADQRWGEILCADGEQWCDRTFCERYYDFLTDIPSRRREVETIDHIFDDKYPADKLRLFYRYYHIRGGAVGWLWSAEEFTKRMEKYMENCVCRECGREIDGDRFKDGTVYVTQGTDGQVLKFTKKDTIGLNKKMLGRYQEEFFCIPCLCEILDTNADRLHEKIHAFKMQGCELFT